MPGRGRRIALVLAALALVLSLGRWGSEFLVERLWESTVSEGVAVLGTRRALLTLALELTGILTAVAWVTGHAVFAGRVALPDRAPPEREESRLWPASLPRWTLAATAVLLGVLLGSGAGAWLDELLLSFDGVRLGVVDPLLGADLGAFLREIPLWFDVQRWLLTVSLATLALVGTLHSSGGTLKLARRRLGVSPRARGQFAILLAAHGMVLAWGALLEPYHLAAGDRGPLLGSEFVLRLLVAEIAAGMLSAAAVVSLLWWLRFRGMAVALVWLLAGLGLAAVRFVPIPSEGATGDPGWLANAKALDSVAFGLGGAESGPEPHRPPGIDITPTLWDEGVLRNAIVEGATVPSAARGTLAIGERRVPVWLAVRTKAGQPPSLLALSDDRVSSAGGLLSWREGDSTTLPGLRSYRDLSPHLVRPGAPAVEASPETRGVPLNSWPRRLVLAWALQEPAALRRPGDVRLAWRLDPTARLSAVIPSVHWTPARPILIGTSLVWKSDGILIARSYPSSTRVRWGGERAAMVRQTLLGLVDANSGTLRVFRWSDADSISAALARISAPVIEPAAALPQELRRDDGYPEELLLAQAEALSGPAWRSGRIDRAAARPDAPAVSLTAGGKSAVVPLMADGGSTVRAILFARRTATGDSVAVIRLDSLRSGPGPSLVRQRWERLPFRFSVADSVNAVGDSLIAGQVRYDLAEEGLLAYQPLWAMGSGGRAQLVAVNVALGDRLGTGHTWVEAWRNLRNEVSPMAAGAAASAVLEQARLWMGRADSALKRGDLQELGRALANLRELLGQPARKP